MTPTEDRASSDEIRRILVANRLREARRLAGLSQGQVAKLMGAHRPTISEIEAANRRVTAQELQRFSELYEVSTAWILGEGANSPDLHDARVQLAARELGKLKPDDLERLLTLLTSMRIRDAEAENPGGTQIDRDDP